MKRAHQHRQYHNVTGWEPPDGIVSVDIDPATGQLATPTCPSSRGEYFLAGTQPVQLCQLHSNGATQVAGWDPAAPKPPDAVPVPSAPGQYRQVQTIPVNPQQVPPVSAQQQQQQPEQQQQQGTEEQQKKKRGFFGRIKDVFK